MCNALNAKNDSLTHDGAFVAEVTEDGVTVQTECMCVCKEDPGTIDEVFPVVMCATLLVAALAFCWFKHAKSQTHTAVHVQPDGMSAEKDGASALIATRDAMRTMSKQQDLKSAHVMRSNDLNFTQDDKEMEYRYFQHIINLNRFKVIVLSVIFANAVYQFAVLDPKKVNYALRFGVAFPCLLVSVPFCISMERFEKYNVLADHLFTLTCSGCGAMLIVIAQMDKYAGSPSDPQFIMAVLMIYVTAVMFGCGNNWWRKAIVVAFVAFAFAVDSIWFVPTDEFGHELSLTDTVKNSFFLIFQSFLVIVVGRQHEDSTRKEFSRKWNLIQEKLELEQKFLEMSSAEKSKEGGFSMGNLRELDLKSPLQQVLAILTSMRGSCDDNLAEGMDKVLEILQNTDDLRAVDLHAKIKAGEIEMDTDISKWLSDTFRHQRNHLTNPEAIAEEKDGSNSLAARTLSRNASVLSQVGPPRDAPYHGAADQSVESAILRYMDVTSNDGPANGHLDWDFDMQAFAEVTVCHPLYYIVLACLDSFNLLMSFNLDRSKLQSFLELVEANYCFDPAVRNPYHNNLHGADVCQTLACIISTAEVRDKFGHLEQLALLFGAAIHDFRHKGVNNQFLMNNSDDLAIIHNDSSVLERFHVGEAFLCMQKEELNVFSEIEKQECRSLRRYMIDLVLATDLSQGFKYITRFQTVLDSDGLSNKETAKDEDIALLMQMCLKCADVSHPCKPLMTHLQWSGVIAEEFFQQGDLETELGMPISPLCDRGQTKDFPKQQQGFIDFVVSPAFRPLSKFCKTDTWMNILQENYRFWHEEQQKGTGIDSMRHKLASIGKAMDMAPSERVQAMRKSGGKTAQSQPPTPTG